MSTGKTDAAIDYLVDYQILKKITSITYPISFGAASSSYTTFLNSSSLISGSAEVIIDFGSQSGTTHYQLSIVNTGSTTIEKTYNFMFDTGTSSNNLSSSYLASGAIKVDFSTGKIEGRQLCKKSNGTQYYIRGIYYR